MIQEESFSDKLRRLSEDFTSCRTTEVPRSSKSAQKRPTTPSRHRSVPKTPGSRKNRYPPLKMVGVCLPPTTPKWIGKDWAVKRNLNFTPVPAAVLNDVHSVESSPESISPPHCVPTSSRGPKRQKTAAGQSTTPLARRQADVIQSVPTVEHQQSARQGSSPKRVCRPSSEASVEDQLQMDQLQPIGETAPPPSKMRRLDNQWTQVIPETQPSQLSTDGQSSQSQPSDEQSDQLDILAMMDVPMVEPNSPDQVVPDLLLQTVLPSPTIRRLDDQFQLEFSQSPPSEQPPLLDVLEMIDVEEPNSPDQVDPDLLLSQVPETPPPPELRFQRVQIPIRPQLPTLAPDTPEYKYSWSVLHRQCEDLPYRLARLTRL